MKMSDFINWETMLDGKRTSRCSGSHIEQLSNLFKDSVVIASNSNGYYQGDDCLVFLFTPADPKIEPKLVLVTSYFGSCSGCDSWDGANDKHLGELLIAIANNARTFNSFEEIDDFFGYIVNGMQNGNFGEYYDLHAHVHRIRKLVKEYETKLGNGLVA